MCLAQCNPCFACNQPLSNVCMCHHSCKGRITGMCLLCCTHKTAVFILLWANALSCLLYFCAHDSNPLTWNLYACRSMMSSWDSRMQTLPLMPTTRHLKVECSKHFLTDGLPVRRSSITHHFTMHRTIIRLGKGGVQTAETECPPTIILVQVRVDF
jgi:hypothetical protein